MIETTTSPAEPRAPETAAELAARNGKTAVLHAIEAAVVSRRVAAEEALAQAADEEAAAAAKGAKKR